MFTPFPRLLAVLPAFVLFASAAPAHAFPPNTLADALPRTADRVRNRVPLLVLSAEQTTIPWENSKAKDKVNELYGVDDDAKPLLPDVLAAFQRQIISCGSLQVAAPLTRINLNTELGPPEEWAQIGRQRATRLLFASLSPAQWASATSPNGLGINDLTKREQKAWFAALMPEPFVLKEVRAADSPGSYQRIDDARTTSITPEQVRLRVTRSVSWMYGSKQPDSGFWGGGVPMYNGHKPGDLFWIAETPEVGSGVVESYRDRIKDRARIEEPNRLRKSDISFATAPLLGKKISLKDAATVGELVVRVAKATGLDLYADRRLSGMRVTYLGPQDAGADAADVLKALCYAISGAVRKVVDPATGETVYLLTNDRDGLMLKRFRLAEWAGDVDALERTEQETFLSAVRSGRIADRILFADEDGIRVSADAMKKAEANLADPEGWRRDSGYNKIPVAALSPSGRDRVQREIQGRLERGADNGSMDTENVYASFHTGVQLLVSGYGTFSGPDLARLGDLLPKKPVPPRPSVVVPAGPIMIPTPLAKFTVLKIAPQDDDETERAAVWARKHGFSALFVRIALWDPTQAERLAAWVTIGKRHGVAISPVISLLRAEIGTNTKTNEALGKLAPARNIWGETLRQYALRRETSPLAATDAAYAAKLQALKTGVWLDSGDAATRKAIADRIHAIAQTPGIAGIVWENVAAPGAASRSGYFDAPQAGLYGGYTNAARVALIRKENVDPVDLPPGYSMPPYVLSAPDGWVPFFWTDSGFPERFQQYPAYRKEKATNTWSVEKSKVGAYDNDAAGWKQLRVERNREDVAALRRAANLPESLPVFVEAPTEPGSFPAWTTPWASSEPLPLVETGKAAFLALNLRRESNPESVRVGLGPQLTQRLGNATPPRFAGLVIDTTAKPLDEALSLLSAVSIQAPARNQSAAASPPRQ